MCALVVPTLCISMGGCNREGHRSDTSSTARASAPPLADLTRLESDWRTQQQVLRVSFAEVASRLGAVRFEAKTRFVFSRGGQDYEQNDLYAVKRDPLGNIHVVLDTPASQLELYLMQGTLYVRHDRGRLRYKPRRDLDTESWCDLVFASLPQSLEPFGHRLRLVAPQSAKVIGRDAVRVKLALAPESEAGQQSDGGKPAPQDLQPPRATPPSLPVAALARWRELARPLDLEGQLWIDSLTAVVLRAEVRGRLEIADRSVRPTQLTLDYDAAITAVGDVPRVEPAQNSIPELERKPVPSDLLGFFREHLEPEEAETQGEAP